MKTKVTEYKYDDFKKGTHFIITSAPNYWNGALNSNCPINNINIKYPYEGIVTHTSGMSAMTDGFYGWSLFSLITENKIKIVKITEERKKKLLKISKI